MGENLSEQKVELAASLSDAVQIPAWPGPPAPQQKTPPQPGCDGEDRNGGRPRLAWSWPGPWQGSVDQLLLAQGLNAVIVLLGGAADLFGLASQLSGGGNGHGRASVENPADRRGRVDGALLRVGRNGPPAPTSATRAGAPWSTSLNRSGCYQYKR